MFKILNETPLPTRCSAPYRGLAYDGCWLYLTQGGMSSIDRLDRCGQLQESFETCRRYSCLCFDSKECCFWAASDQSPFSLFKLDRYFREIDSLRLHVRGQGIVTGLSYHCCADQVWVAFAAGIALVDKAGFAVREQTTAQWTKGVLALCPYSMSWTQAGGETTTYLYDQEHRMVESRRMPCALCVEAAVLDPCAEECGLCVVYVLATRRGRYPYLLRCVLENECACHSLCPCNAQLCHCKPPCEKSRACDDVLESIALMEAALSHILNAEGEKLQKAIALTDDPCKLLEINKAVNATLINATHLEHVLFNKLEMLQEICCCTPDACACACEPVEHEG